MPSMMLARAVAVGLLVVAALNVACADDTGANWHRKLITSSAGRTIKVGGLNAYVVAPQNAISKKNASYPAVLIYTDIYGWEYNNTRAWADRLARDGFVVVVPDFFKNDSWTPARAAAGENLTAWITKFTVPQVLDETSAILRDLKNNSARLGLPRIGKVGAEGFCWGGRFSVLFTNGRPPLGSAGVVYHGSRITLQEVQGINAPLLFLQSDPKIDNNLNTTVYKQFEGVLATKKSATGLDLGIRFYPNQPHGFSLRGDPNNTETVKAADDAFKRGSAFLKKNLK